MRITEIIKQLHDVATSLAFELNERDIIDTVVFDVRCSLNENLVPTGGGVKAEYIIKGTGMTVHIHTVYCHKPQLQRIPEVEALLPRMKRLLKLAREDYEDWLIDNPEK